MIKFLPKSAITRHAGRSGVRPASRTFLRKAYLHTPDGRITQDVRGLELSDSKSPVQPMTSIQSVARRNPSQSQSQSDDRNTGAAFEQHIPPTSQTWIWHERCQITPDSPIHLSSEEYSKLKEKAQNSDSFDQLVTIIQYIGVGIFAGHLTGLLITVFWI